jgi:ribosomal protein S18 acetylase RimI-like enzyme
MAEGVQIRAGESSDVAFLEEMLFEAFFWDEAVARPALGAFRVRPEFAKIVAGWGRLGDRLLVAVTDTGQRLGAAWFRLWTPEVHSYGFVSDDVPELGLAVVRAHRTQGIGRALLRAIIDTARRDNFRALSLSVNPANPARGLYESEGFRRVGQSGTSWTMVCDVVFIPGAPSETA